MAAVVPIWRAEPVGQSVRQAEPGNEEEALSKAGLSPSELNITMEVNSNEAIRAAVERGVAVAFLSSRDIAREIHDGRLVPVEVEGMSACRDLYLITDPQRMPTSVARAFLAFLDQWGDKPPSTVENLLKPHNPQSRYILS